MGIRKYFFGNICFQCEEKIPKDDDQHIIKSGGIFRKNYSICARCHEKNKIIKAEKRRKIREEVEKEVYGKIKTNRQSIGEADKEEVFEKFGSKCAVCGEMEGLHIHHKDKNPNNNMIENLTILCGVCHKKIHMKVR